jgi:hypothetical protein
MSKLDDAKGALDDSLRRKELAKSRLRRYTKEAIERQDVHIANVRKLRSIDNKIRIYEQYLETPTVDFEEFKKSSEHLEELNKRRQILKLKIQRNRTRKLGAIAKKRYWLDRFRMFAVRVKNRRKLVKQLRRDPANIKFETWMLNGKPGNINSECKWFLAVAVVKFKLTCTSTTGGVHAPTSFHYSGRAIDVAGSWDRMVAYQRWLLKVVGPGSMHEMFGPDDELNADNGIRITLGSGTFLEDLHDTHVHVAAG